MARKRTTKSGRLAKKQSTDKKAGRQSAQPTSSKAKQSVPAREPWTPWGKWLRDQRQQRERKQREIDQRRQQRQTARRRRWARRRLITTRGLVFLALLVLACVVAGVVIVILGRPYPWESIAQVRRVFDLTDQIGAQQARWESLAVEHYEVEIEYTDSTGAWCGPATIEVRNGIIVNLPSPDDTHWFPPDRCDELFDELVIGQSFAWLERQVSDYQPATSFLDITFDESFGSPTQAEAGLYDSDSQKPGCCWRVNWRHLRPLYDE